MCVCEVSEEEDGREEEEADTELKIIRPDNPTCYQLSRLRLSKEKQEGGEEL